MKKMHLTKLAIAGSTVACAALFSFSWSEQPPRVTSNSSGCGQSNSSTREAGQGTVSLSLFPGQEL
ncbi:hypothetical protein QJT78_51455, partial [Bradyrhizobium sp. Mp27]|nr:hypothetical protein [Bradyrhizobium sp. Mp27]